MTTVSSCGLACGAMACRYDRRYKRLVCVDHVVYTTPVETGSSLPARNPGSTGRSFCVSVAQVFEGGMSEAARPPVANGAVAEAREQARRARKASAEAMRARRGEARASEAMRGEGERGHEASEARRGEGEASQANRCEPMRGRVRRGERSDPSEARRGEGERGDASRGRARR